MIAVTISPIQRSAAPTVEEMGWALSFQWGLTNATAGRPPSRRALTNSDALRMCARPSGLSMIRCTYWKGLWWGTSPCLAASAPAPQPVSYQPPDPPPGSGLSEVGGAVWGGLRLGRA